MSLAIILLDFRELKEPLISWKMLEQLAGAMESKDDNIRKMRDVIKNPRVNPMICHDILSLIERVPLFHKRD